MILIFLVSLISFIPRPHVISHNRRPQLKRGKAKKIRLLFCAYIWDRGGRAKFGNPVCSYAQHCTGIRTVVVEGRTFFLGTILNGNDSLRFPQKMKNLLSINELLSINSETAIHSCSRGNPEKGRMENPIWEQNGGGILSALLTTNQTRRGKHR